MITNEKIDQIIENYTKFNCFSGNVLIIKGTEIISERSYGYANYELNVQMKRDSIFQIASLSKSFTAVMIFILLERKKLNLKDPLSKYLPDFNRAGEIQIQHLLAHQSGIQNINNLAEYDQMSKLSQKLENIIKTIQNFDLLFDPGTDTKYSNTNYNILAYIIEKITNMSYQDFLKKEISQPLQLKTLRHETDQREVVKNRVEGYIPAGLDSLENSPYINWSIKTGNGSLQSSIQDLYYWDKESKEHTLLTDQSYNIMFEKEYGWFKTEKFGKKIIYLSGRSPGYNAYYLRVLEDNLTIIILSNNYAPTVEPITENLLLAYYDKPTIDYYGILDSKLQIKHFEVSNIEQYTGLYQFEHNFFIPNLEVKITLEKDQIQVIWYNNERITLVPLGKNKFLLRIFWSILLFNEQEKEGKLIFYYLDKPFTAKKILKKD